MVQCVRDRLQLVPVVRRENLDGGLAVAGERVAVHLLHLRHRHQVRSRIEVVQVGYQDPESVSDLPVRLDDARQDLVAQPHFLPVVGHRYPEAEDLGAVPLDHGLRIDAVAARL